MGSNIPAQALNLVRGIDANSFWEFSISVYKRPGVADYCLNLQDKHGALVNLLLFCCWLGLQQRRLDRALLKQVERVISGYNGRVTQIIRAERRQLLGTDSKQQVKRALLAQELNAEREEQDRLFAWFADGLDLPVDYSGSELVAINVQCYLNELDGILPSPEVLVDAALNCCAARL